MNIELTGQRGIRLLTQGKLCQENIEVSPALQSKSVTANGIYTPDEGYAGLGEVTVAISVPDGYVVPSGTKSITANGTHDVSGYANAQVAVPVGVFPSGTKTITANGTHDVSGYANAEVNVEAESGGLAINGIIEQYKVNAGAAVNAGDFVEFVTKWGSGTFESGEALHISAAALTDSKVLVTYRDKGNSGKGTAVVLTVEDGAIAVGTATVFESGSTSFTSAVALTDSKVLVAYCDNGNSNYGTAIVLTVDGTTVTAGTAVVFESAWATYISAVALTDSKVLVAYCDDGNSNYGTAIVLTVDGTTVTAGTAVVFESAHIARTCAVALTDSKVLVAYYDTGNSFYGTACVLTVSGTTVTAGTAVVFESGTTNHISAVALTDSKVLVAYCDNDNSGKGTACVLTVSGTTITAGTAVVFESGSTSDTSAVALTDSKVLVVYCDNGNSSKGTAIVLTVSGTTVTAGTAVVFGSGSTSYIAAVALTDASALVAYDNGTGAFSGFAIDGTTVTANKEGGTFVCPATSRLHNVGVAKTGGAEGETVDVYVVG